MTLMISLTASWIRTRVFVIEQTISAGIETDKWENDSTHPDRVFSSLGLVASNE